MTELAETQIFSETIPTAIGSRVKGARMMTGLTRKDFSLSSKISIATLRSWEEPGEGRRGLTRKGSLRLADALLSHGVHCISEWLLTGEGPGPQLITHFDTTSPENNEIVSWSEEESILRDVESFKQNNPSPVIMLVTDEQMSPIFNLGDYVGGSKVSGNKIQGLIGSISILETDRGLLLRRLVSRISENKYVISSVCDKVVDISIEPSTVEVISAAEVVWHRWRSKAILS